MCRSKRNETAGLTLCCCTKDLLSTAKFEKVKIIISPVLSTNKHNAVKIFIPSLEINKKIS